MPERFKPTFNKLTKNNMTLYSLKKTSIGDFVYSYLPVIGIYGKGSEQIVLYCNSVDLESCNNCPVKDICPRPFGTENPLHRNPMPLDTAMQYFETPKSSNSTK